MFEQKSAKNDVYLTQKLKPKWFISQEEKVFQYIFIHLKRYARNSNIDKIY